MNKIPVDLVSREAAMALVFDSLDTTVPLAVASANLDHIHHFGADCSWMTRPDATSGHTGTPTELRWLTLLDGFPLARRARNLTGQKWPKLSGSDLIGPILDRAAAAGARVGFLGGFPDTQLQLATALRERRPNLTVTGMWAPLRSELTDPEACRTFAERIRAAGTEILVVALGKPRQEQWISQYAPATGARVLLAFGAVVDFLSGRASRAPTWVANGGLEWAWRLAREPRRLGRRYLVEGPPALMCLERRARLVPAGEWSNNDPGGGAP